MWFSDNEANALTLRAGDLVVCEGGDAGRCAFLRTDLPGYGFQNSVNRVRPFGNNFGGYLAYWLMNLKANGFLDVICNRSTIAHYTAEKLAGTPLLIPPSDEQFAIAAFLDRETAKIDALVAEQERLIALLKEKRQAVISHAVAKGSAPNVPMKNSGVDWLDNVPFHWAVCRIGYYANVENGSTPSRDNPGYWNDGTIPWISSAEVNQYVVREPSELITVAALKECSLRLLPEGAVLVGLVGQGRTRGMSALLSFQATINQNVAAILTKPELLSNYLHYSLQAAYEFMREHGRGGNQAAMNCEILASFRIALPPKNEQADIVRHLDEVHELTMQLTAEAERAIALLKERRAALISAAVTGKIDVRGLVPDALQAA